MKLKSEDEIYMEKRDVLKKLSYLTYRYMLFFSLINITLFFIAIFIKIKIRTDYLNEITRVYTQSSISYAWMLKKKELNDIFYNLVNGKIFIKVSIYDENEKLFIEKERKLTFLEKIFSNIPGYIRIYVHPMIYSNIYIGKIVYLTTIFPPIIVLFTMLIFILLEFLIYVYSRSLAQKQIINKLYEEEKEAFKKLYAAYKRLKTLERYAVNKEKMLSIERVLKNILRELLPFVETVNKNTKGVREVINDFQTLILELKDNILYESIFKKIYILKNFLEIIEKKSNEVFQYLSKLEKIINIHASDEILTFDLIKLIKQIIERKKIEHDKEIIFELIPSKKKINITSNEKLITYAINNIFENSIIHGFEGREKGKIRIKIKETKDRVIIIIEDNGKGMDKETLSKSLEPFYTTKYEPNRGFGLSITYNIIKELYGIFHIASKPGKGTKVLIALPRNIIKAGKD